MCLIGVSGMWSVPWVCFHTHRGVILSGFRREGEPRPKKQFGNDDGNDRNWKQIMRASGPSSRRRNLPLDVEPGVSQQRGAFVSFIQNRSAWCCVWNSSRGLWLQKQKDGLSGKAFCRRMDQREMSWLSSVTLHCDNNYSISLWK